MSIKIILSLKLIIRLKIGIYIESYMALHVNLVINSLNGNVNKNDIIIGK